MIDFAIICLICIAVGGLGCIFYETREWTTIAILFLVIYVFGTFVVLGNMFPLKDYPSPDREMRIEIVSLDRNLAIHGSFALGGGTIDSKMVYYAYTKLDDGGYKLIQIPEEYGSNLVREVVLYERDDIVPTYLITYICEEDTPYSFTNWIRGCERKDILYIPTNTIIKEFKG